MEDTREVATVEVSIGEQSTWREIVIENGAIPEDVDLLVQDMVDTLLDREGEY